MNDIYQKLHPLLFICFPNFETLYALVKNERIKILNWVETSRDNQQIIYKSHCFLWVKEVIYDESRIKINGVYGFFISGMFCCCERRVAEKMTQTRVLEN